MSVARHTTCLISREQSILHMSSAVSLSVNRMVNRSLGASLPPAAEAKSRINGKKHFDQAEARKQGNCKQISAVYLSERNSMLAWKSKLPPSKQRAL